MKWIAVCAASISAVLCGFLVSAQDAKQAEPAFWMKKKLEFSQHILAGLATADYAQISKSAASMNNLSEIEKWTRRTNAEAYRTQLQFFRYANEELIRQADKKNIDGAALAYTQLTLSCVNCHKVLRDTKQ